MTNLVELVNVKPDYWSIGNSIASSIIAVGAVAVAIVSLLHSRRANKASSKTAAESAQIAQDAASANRHTFMEQKRLVNHQIQHDKLSVKPELMNLQIRAKTDDKLGFYVLNSGLGPARVGIPMVVLNGVALGGLSIGNGMNIEEIFKRELDIPSGMFSSWHQGSYMTILPGERLSLLFAGDNTDQQSVLDWMNSHAAKIRFVIPYTSMYGDELWFNTDDENLVKMYPDDELKKNGFPIK